MSKYRKAIAAFIAPLLGLPIAAWVSGKEAFDAGTLIGAVAVAAGAAALVYFSPNTDGTPPSGTSI